MGADLNNDDGSDSGSAYIFSYDGSSWSEVTKITASDANAGDRFGSSVAINGNRAIVGARFKEVRNH